MLLQRNSEDHASRMLVVFCMPMMHVGACEPSDVFFVTFCKDGFAKDNKHSRMH